MKNLKITQIIHELKFAKLRLTQGSGMYIFFKTLSTFPPPFKKIVNMF